MLTQLKLTNMNYRNSIFKFMGIAALALAVTSCVVDDAQTVPHVELGALEKEFVVEADASTVEIEIYANSAYRVERINESEDWLNLTYGDIVEGKSVITAEATFNEGFKRKAGLVLCSEFDGRRDTLYVKQKALIEARLQFAEASITPAGAGGAVTYPITSNIPFEDVTVEVLDDAGNTPDWVESIVIEDNETDERQMVVTLAANPSDVAPRAASVAMSFTDGWGDTQLVEFNLLQRTSKETFGDPISMEDFCLNYATGKVIDQYVLLEGVIVSNKDGFNNGEPEQKTTSTVDYEIAERTAYLQTKDGSRGIALIMDTTADNVFDQWDNVQILIHGATGVLKENPDRYELKGVKKTMITQRVAGSKADITVKKRTIATLTDTDIYTYVTVENVYFPVRKGSFFPVNGGYAIESNAHRNCKYPTLMVDTNGDDMYLMTNAKCVYRSNGRCKPYGTGSVSGVVAHERYARFNWRNGADPAEIEDDPTLGFIGRYCLRHQTEGDIYDQMETDVEKAAVAILCEYRWWNPDYDNKVMKPSYGTNGWFTHTYQPKYTGDETIAVNTATYQQYMFGSGNYAYLGPVGTSKAYYFGANWGNVNGLGMVIDPAKEYTSNLGALPKCISTNPDGTKEWAGQYAEDATCGHGAAGHPDDAKVRWAPGKTLEYGMNLETGNTIPTSCTCINYNTTSMRGKANAYGASWQGWGKSNWYSYEKDTFYAWLIMVDMSKVSYAQHPVLQISALNTANTNAPRLWALEWSASDDQKGAWSRIAEYDLADTSAWANTLFSSSTAYEGINFKLPEEVCGLSEVYFRLIPTSTLCSEGGDYGDSVLTDTTAQGSSSLEYIAVRYTK